MCLYVIYVIELDLDWVQYCIMEITMHVLRIEIYSNLPYFLLTILN